MILSVNSLHPTDSPFTQIAIKLRATSTFAVSARTHSKGHTYNYVKLTEMNIKTVILVSYWIRGKSTTEFCWYNQSRPTFWIEYYYRQ